MSLHNGRGRGLSSPGLPKRRLRIVLTANAAWNIAHFRRPLVEALVGDGHELIVMAPEDAAVDVLEDLGCRFTPLPMDQAGLNPFRDLALAWRMRQTLSRLEPDVVLGFTIKNNLYGAAAARSLSVPFIPNVTGLGTAFLAGRALRVVAETLYRLAFGGLPRVFFQNEDDLQLFVDRGLVNPSQVRLLPGSGVNLERFGAAPRPRPGTAPTFLMIARVLRDKGVLEYVEAARIVRQRHPEARFQLLGAVDAENRTAIDLATVQSWGASHGVEYLGTSADVRTEITAAHCVVLPSYREGAPRTLIEAAAMARPLITTDVPGCRSVVDHGVNGLLCTPRSAESLADACLTLLAMPPRSREEMGRAGRRKMVREYDEVLVVKAYRDALTEVT
jgi:glycosyltransferase involved in cell wall biosynthesis